VRLVWRLLVCLACYLLGLAFLPVIAIGNDSLSGERSGSSSSQVMSRELLPAERQAVRARHRATLSAHKGYSAGGSFPVEAAHVPQSFDGSLVTPTSPVEGEEMQDERQARLDNPEAVALREESRTKFEALKREQAAKLAGKAFPALVDEAAGGPPKMSRGESIVGFPADNAAQVELPGGKHGVLESIEPMAIETSAGHRAPVDLSLDDVGDAYEPTAPAVKVRIPKRLSQGARLANDGVSLTPVTGQGAALGGAEGTLNGNTVFYANTQTNADTLAKPTTGGFELDTLLRAANSPEVLYFRVGMPATARLRSDAATDGVNVVLDGRTIAMVTAPSAQDAEGTSVPVRMTVAGNTLVLAVPHSSGEYEYPIAVDPHAYDSTLGLPSTAGTNWEFHYEKGGYEEYTLEGAVMRTVGGITEGQHDEFRYPAHGSASVTYIESESKVIAFYSRTKLEFVHESTVEEQYTLAGVLEGYERTEKNFCDKPVEEEGGLRCGALYHGNEARFTQTATQSAPAEDSIWLHLYNATAGIRQETGPEVSFNTSEATIADAGARQNVLYGSGGWLGEANGAVEIIAKDPGLGVSDLKIKDLTAGAHGEHWEFNDPVYAEHLCTGIWCNETFKTNGANGMYFTYNKEMAEGANTFELCAEDEAFMKTCTDATVKVDGTPPGNIKLKAMAESGAELTAMSHPVTVEATDAASGVKSIAVSLDGTEIGSPTGSCPLGECTASRTVTINGENLGAGEHKLEIVATDNAGNVSPKKVITFGIRNATPMHVGPGSLDPITGQFALAATDVDIPGAGRVSRTYMSRSLRAGAEGPLGPQWSLSLGTGQSLKVLPNGNVELKGAGGESTTFESNGEGGFTAPPGDGNLTLEYKGQQAEYFAIGLKEHREKVAEGPTYMLKDPAQGATTRFTLPSGSAVWVPSVTEGSAEGDATGYAYKVVVPTGGSPITEPTEVLGPVPAGVTCAENPHKVNLEALNPGCRALAFTYAEKTTATGEGASEWGEYNGRLVKVSFTGYSTASKKMESITVAQYAYDKQGRLRAEWDPRISPALKTTYGYDAEGHVTALTPPGEEPWAFTYGTIAGDGNPGRLLKVMRPPASTGLWGGSLPSKTEAPKLSGTPVVGVKMSVSNGAWANSPFAYTYQWEDCSAAGGECTPILGATNPSYTVAASDVGHTLVAQVGAINGGGTVLASSAQSATAEFTSPGGSPSYTQSVDSGSSLNAVSCVPGTTTCVVSDSAGKALYATNVSVSSAATWSTWSGPSGESPSQAVDCPTTTVCMLADGKESAGGRLYYATSLGGSWTQAYSPSYGVDAISCASSSFCVDGQDNYGYFRYSTSPASTSWTLEYQGEAGMKGISCLSSSFCAMVDSVGDVHVADSTSQIESESWTSTNVDGTSALNGVACTSTTSCVAVDGAGNVIDLAISGSAATAFKHDIDGTNDLTAVTCTGSSTCVTVDNQGNVFVSTNGGESWVKELALSDKLTGVSCASASLCVAVDTTGSVTAFYPGYTQSVDSGSSLNAVSCVPGTTTCVVSDSAGKALYATNVSTTAAGTWNTWSGPSGVSPSQAVDCPSTSLCLLADGKNASGGNLYYATSLGGAWSKAFEPSFGIIALSCASSSFCIDGQGESGGYIRYSASPGSASWTAEDIAGSANVKGVSCLSSSFCASVDSVGDVHVADSTSQIESESWTSTDVDGTSALNGVACTSTTSCVAVDGAGNVIDLAISGSAATAFKHDIDANNDLTAVSCTGSSTCLAVDNQGNVFVSTNAGESWSKQYGLGDKLTGVSCASVSLCVAVDTTGNVTAFDPVGPVHEGEPRSPQPGTTIEYRVPLSGEGAPNQMTSTELAKWGEKEDVPNEATAVFPPDEPMGWPASDYKRATIDYMDAQARTVNMATPSGGMSTTEYNHLNEVTRTLTADNRATALKAGSKSAEVAEALSSKNIYSSEGAQLLETYGPEHKIKLANGTEEQTRNRQQFAYNNEAPSEEAHELVTHETEWEETATKGVLAKRETFKSYNGQEGLGWKLRKPTQVTSVVEGHTTTGTTVYEKEMGNVQEATSSASAGAPVYASQFGSEGKGNGQFGGVAGVAGNAAGEVLVVDPGNDRVQRFSTEGVYLSAFGSKGTGNGQFEQPWGVAVNKGTGNAYVTDSGNDRVQEFSSSGALVRAWGFGVSDGKAEFEVCTSSCKAGIAGTGSGQLSDPLGVAIDGSGNVWVVDSGNDRVEEFSSEGAYIKSVGSEGSGKLQFKEPKGIAFSGRNLYVSDYGNNRIEELSGSGAYVFAFGTKGSGSGQLDGPAGIASDPVAGDLMVADSLNDRVEEFTTVGTFVTAFGAEGAGSGQFKDPLGVTVNSEGSIYVGDAGNSRVQELEPLPAAPDYTSKFGSYGTESGKFKEPRATAVTSTGSVYVMDTGNSRVEEFSAAGGFLGTFGKEGSGNGEFKSPYGMAEDSKGNLWIADTGNNRVQQFNSKNEYHTQFGKEGAGAGQLKEPKGVAVTANGYVFVVDAGNNRIDKFKENGEFVLAFGYGVSNGKAEFEICTTTCQAGVTGSGNGQFNGPRGIAVSASGDVWVADAFNDRVEEFKEDGEYLAKFGSAGKGSGQLEEPKALATTSAGNVLVVDTANDRIQEFTPSGAYMTTFGDKGTGNGQLEEPWGVAVAPSGAMYVDDVKNNRVEQWTPAPRRGNEAAQDKHTVYYTAKGEAEVAACQNHPEWTGLVCQTEPVAQPGDSGPPPLPVTTTTYNTWEEPETVTEQIGSVTRTTTRKYDGAGRETSSEETSTASEDKALPAVTDEYNSETGALAKLTSTIEGKARTVTSVYNTLAQLTSYTDAEGATTKYSYDVDGRIEGVSEAQGSQSYAYDSTTGFLTKLMDSAAGTFTASYDVEGKILTADYPDGLMAKYAYNSIGQTTSLEYEKTTDCSEKCVWFSDTDAFGPKGELASQVSTLSSESYSYSEAGRLMQAQETPVGGKGCTTRQYGYNEGGQRESATTTEPNEKGECSTEGGVVEGHVYDIAGRLIDPGVAYDALGNMTKTPALDAGGEAIASSFYVDNQVATQEQNEKSISYTYDPTGRTMVAKTKAKSGTSIAISHYAGPGQALTWTCEEEEGKKECEEEKAVKWTRYVPGIDGALDAIESASGTTVLELHDLQGNIVASAADNQTETKLLTTHISTEFGVPVGAPTKYGWLGANGAQSELETGVITSAGATYVPQLARTLQTEHVIPPGAAPNGVMQTEAYRPPELGWSNQSGAEGATNTVAEQRALERAARKAACEAAPWTCVTIGEDPLLEFAVNQANAEVLYVAVSEVYLSEGKAEFARVIAVLIALAGKEGAVGLLSSREVQDNEFGTGAVQEWLWTMSHALYNCIVQDETTFAGGNKVCKIQFYSVSLEGDENFFDEVQEPEWTWLPAVWWCQYGECYLQDHGLIENPR
jgi:YD repeat-containing protein